MATKNSPPASMASSLVDNVTSDGTVRLWQATMSACSLSGSPKLLIQKAVADEPGFKFSPFACAVHGLLLLLPTLISVPRLRFSAVIVLAWFSASAFDIVLLVACCYLRRL